MNGPKIRHFIFRFLMPSVSVFWMFPDKYKDSDQTKQASVTPALMYRLVKKQRMLYDQKFRILSTASFSSFPFIHSTYACNLSTSSVLEPCSTVQEFERQVKIILAYLFNLKCRHIARISYSKDLCSHSHYNRSVIVAFLKCSYRYHSLRPPVSLSF